MDFDLFTDKQSMVQGGRPISMESTTADTDLNHDDSGISQDQSVIRTDDSNCSEQELVENYSQPIWFSHNSDGSLSSIGFSEFHSDSKSLTKNPNIRDSGLSERSFEEDEFDVLSRGFQHLQLQKSMADYHLSNGKRVSFCCKADKPSACAKQRLVPRMGTKHSLCRNKQILFPILQEQLHSTVQEHSVQSDNPVWLRRTGDSANDSISDKSTSMKHSVLNAEKYFLTSDYSTGESSCSTPVMSQKLSTYYSAEEKAKASDALSSPLLSSLSNQTKTCGDNALAAKVSDHWNTMSIRSPTEESKDHLHSLHQLNTQHVDVMYTNRANLEHTIMVQQKLYENQIRSNLHRHVDSKFPIIPPNEPGIHEAVQAKDIQVNRSESQEVSPVPMEWVVKRRSDGSRYITRRPVRSQILRDRAKRLAEERCGLTTDDDSIGDLKLGRYWSRDKRKLHLEQSRYHRQWKELTQQRNKMEAVGENGEQPNIIELSRRKVMRRKSNCLTDSFVTVQEMLAHGNRDPFDHTANPLLSVTTV